MTKKIVVKIHTHDPKCKYKSHKGPGGEFGIELLAPAGMCMDAYFAAYPYCLSLMYGAEFKFMPEPNTVTFQCPAPINPVVMEARRIKLDEKNSKIIITVKDILKKSENCANTCECRMKIGLVFEFNHMGQCPEICPAGFLHIFPYLNCLLRGGSLPWSTGKQSFLVHCPDEKINVTYEVILEEDK